MKNTNKAVCCNEPAKPGPKYVAPKTPAEQKRMDSGGEVRGKGCATKGTKFSGTF